MDAHTASMMSEAAFTAMIYGALVLSVVAPVALALMLLRDWMKGDVW